MKLKKVSFLLSLLFMFLVLVKSDARGADKLIADYGGHAGFQSAIWVAKDLKVFDKYGLDVDVLMITGSARSVAALMGGSTQFATGSVVGPLAAVTRGSDIRLIAASYNKFPYAFVVRSDIRTPKDLRGKKINILNFGGSNDIALQLAFKEWGLKMSDAQVIIGGDAPTRLASLMAGRMDATILSPPHLTIATQAGYRVLADMGDMNVAFTQSSLYARGNYLKENRDRAKRFLRAYSEAIHVIKTDRTRTMKVFANRMLSSSRCRTSGGGQADIVGVQASACIQCDDGRQGCAPRKVQPSTGTLKGGLQRHDSIDSARPAATNGLSGGGAFGVRPHCDMRPQCGRLREHAHLH